METALDYSVVRNSDMSTTGFYGMSTELALKRAGPARCSRRRLLARKSVSLGSIARRAERLKVLFNRGAFFAEWNLVIDLVPGDTQIRAAMGA